MIKATITIVMGESLVYRDLTLSAIVVLISSNDLQWSRMAQGAMSPLHPFELVYKSYETSLWTSQQTCIVGTSLLTVWGVDLPTYVNPCDIRQKISWFAMLAMPAWYTRARHTVQLHIHLLLLEETVNPPAPSTSIMLWSKSTMLSESSCLPPRIRDNLPGILYIDIQPCYTGPCYCTTHLRPQLLRGLHWLSNFV